MRAWRRAAVALLALAACGENAGWNPNYRAKATPYGDYLRARESALMGRRADPPRIVPVTLPVKAPTPEQISGHSMRPVPEATLARTRKPAGAPSMRASTRWMMFSVMSCSPAEMKILVPVTR